MSCALRSDLQPYVNWYCGLVQCQMAIQKKWFTYLKYKVILLGANLDLTNINYTFIILRSVVMKCVNFKM